MNDPIMRQVLKWSIFMIFLLISCQGADESGMVHFGTFSNYKYSRVTVKYLKEPSILQGHPCRRGKVRFHFNDSLLSFRSSADIQLDGGIIPAGSRIYLYDNGMPEYVWLSGDTEIKGYQISSRKRMQGSQLSFYSGGELWKFRPVTDVEIDGIWCSHDKGIELYPDGSLLSCHLARDVQERDQHFTAGTRILKDEDGLTHPYSFSINEATFKLMNIDEDFSEPLLYAYQKRMEGKVDSVRKTFKPNEQDRNPMNHYELARIKRHCLIGGAEEDLNSYLYSVNLTMRGNHNVITVFFHAESMLFVERNKAKLREDRRDDNFYDPAIREFEWLLEMKPDYHAARLHLVDIYSHIPGDLGGDMEKAKKHAAELSKYDSVWAARAEAILLSGEEKLLDFWLRIAPSHRDDPILQQELGRAYLSEGDVKHAEGCFRKAMELDPQKCTLLVDLARFHIRGLQRDKVRAPEHLTAAENYLLEYIRTDPVNPHKAWCYAKLSWLKDLAGESEEGSKLLEQAKQLDMRFSREEAPPSMLLFIPLDEVYHEFESYFSLSSNKHLNY